MRKCSLTSGCGAGDEINFSTTRFEVYAHQNGGRAIHLHIAITDKDVTYVAESLIESVR